MKCRIFYIISIMLLGSVSLLAQPDTEAPMQQQNLNTEERTKTKLGLKFTMGGHTFRGDAFDNEKLMYGFGAGVYNIAGLNKKKSLNLHSELDFTFKGSKFGTLNDTAFSKISLFYMEVPVYLSIRLFNTPLQQPMHLLVGAQFGYLFRSSLNKSFGRFGEVKTDLPFQRMDFSPAIGVRKEIGSGMSLQFCFKMGLMNIYSNGFKERVDNPDLDNKNYDYRDISPTLKDGTHKAKNIGFELSLMF